MLEVCRSANRSVILRLSRWLMFARTVSVTVELGSSPSPTAIYSWIEPNLWDHYLYGIQCIVCILTSRIRGSLIRSEARRGQAALGNAASGASADVVIFDSGGCGGLPKLKAPLRDACWNVTPAPDIRGAVTC